MKILNIAAGKFDPLDISPSIPSFVLNIDTSYFSDSMSKNIEQYIESWEKNPEYNRRSQKEYLSMDIFEFMERTRLIFDRVVIYRFLEHVSFTQVDYFIYLVSTILKKDGLVDIIVPNYDWLAKMILNEPENIDRGCFGPYDDFTGWNTQLTTELLNEPSCPHASIWTPYRAKKFWEREKRFIVEPKTIKETFQFDGRNIYLRFFAKRV
jgi:hypothetical protein